MWFKKNCKHYDIEQSADFDISVCGDFGNEKVRLRRIDSEISLRYHPCMEKHCPVLQACKKK